MGKLGERLRVYRVMYYLVGWPGARNAMWGDALYCLRRIMSGE